MAARATAGLIDHVNFPLKSADLHVTDISDSARVMRSMGRAVEDKTSTISTTWGRLPASYRAPEQEQVFAVMQPAVTSAAALRTRFDDAARLVDTYAGALEAIKPRLADVERRARVFRARVVGGVWVDASSASGASFTDHLGALGELVGVEERQVRVPWNEDHTTFEKNAALLAEYAQILEDVRTAAAACADGINGLNTNVCVAPVELIPAEAFLSADSPSTWGSPGTELRNCPESVGAGAHTFFWGLADGVRQLAVGYNPANGDYFSGEAYGQAWGGLGDLVGSIAVLVSPVGWAAAGMSMTGNNTNGFSDWMYDRAVTVRNAGGALVGWDPNAADGWHAWKEDGVAAGTGAVLSVGTFFIPAAGQVAGGLKAGSLGARVARVTAAVSEFAVQGGSWAVKGGVKVITGLRTMSARFDLDGLGQGFGPQLAVAGAGGTVRANPFAGLLNAMSDGPGTSTGTAGRTPVRDAFFGPRQTPVLDNPRIEAPRAEAPVAPRVEAPDTPRVEAPRAHAPSAPRADAPAATGPDASRPDTPDGARPHAPQEPARVWSPEDEPITTVPGTQAPNPDYTQADVQDALDRAPSNAEGQPVDHRTGEPLNATRTDGNRGWNMVWDPEHNLWIAERPGTGHPAPGTMPDTGTPNTFGYDEHGQLMKYANNRPHYAPDQVQAVWDAAPKRTDEHGKTYVLVRDLDNNPVRVYWEPGQPRTDLWDMGHIPDLEYRKLREEYLSHRITEAEFLAEYHNPRNYQVSHPGRNRAHLDETP